MIKMHYSKKILSLGTNIFSFSVLPLFLIRLMSVQGDLAFPFIACLFYHEYI